MAIEQFIENEVKANDVVLFMKGTPQFPQCGFSGQVVQILDHLGVSYKGLNVLESDDLRNGIKAYSNWPTIPQLYVKGEFVGGCDIIRDVPGRRVAADAASQGRRDPPDGLRSACPEMQSPRRSGGFRLAAAFYVARIIFDHQMRLHLHRVGHVGDQRDARERGAHLGAVDVDIVRHVRSAKACASSTSAICFDFSFTSTTSPTFTR